MDRVSRRIVSAWLLLCIAGPGVEVATAADSTDRVTTVAPASGRLPVVARIDPTGTIHVLYDAPDGPWYQKMTSEGAPVGSAIAVVDPGSRQPGLEFTVFDVAVGRAGRVHVAMGTNAWKLKLPKPVWGFQYASLAPGAKQFTPVRNINGQPSEGFSLAADDQGNVTACWLADKLYANVSHNDGKTFSPTVQINSKFNPCNCCTTSSVYAADGRVAVLYREETDNNRDMYLVLWDQAKRTSSIERVSGAPWTVDACPMTYYSIARRADGFTAAWPTKGSIYFARLDSRGTPLSPGEVKTPGASGMRTGVLGLTATDGATLVTWKKDGRLGWQLYDADARPIGQPGSADSPGSGAAGVVRSDGRFVLFR